METIKSDLMRGMMTQSKSKEPMSILDILGYDVDSSMKKPM